MAGTLTISTLSDGTNSTSSTNCIRGSAKAWVRYSAYTNTVTKAYNVSSITLYGSDVWGVNFTNAIADANYAWSANAGTAYNNNAGFQWSLASLADYTGNANWAVPTTSQIRFKNMNLSGTGYNFDRVSVVIFD